MEINNQKGYLKLICVSFTSHYISYRIKRSKYIQIYLGQIVYIISSSRSSFLLLVFFTDVVQYAKLQYCTVGHIHGPINQVYFLVNMNIRPISYNPYIVDYCTVFLRTSTRIAIIFYQNLMISVRCLWEVWSYPGTYI